MKTLKIALSIILYALAQGVYAQQTTDKKMNSFISNLMGKMTLEEKIGQLNLDAGFGIAIDAPGQDIVGRIKLGFVGATGAGAFATNKQMQDAALQSRLKIPLLFGRDIIHGYATTFPIPLALSCTWDMPLIEQSARIAATEATAEGINWTYSPMVDIARDPRWGRIAEGAGEDPWLGSQVAKAMVKGYQGDDLTKPNALLACVKHFALYGAVEGGRDYNTSDMSHIVMYNDYLPPYKAASEAGAGSFMSSFNLIDRIPATTNKWLLTDLLRNEWGFKGFVVTDYNSITEIKNHGLGDLREASAMALKAGTDMDMGASGFINTLKKSLSEGKVTQKEINQACRRVLETKYKMGLFDDPYRRLDEKRLKTDLLTKENLSAAREIAKHTLVLLKNEKNILPLKKTGTIAVIGPLANTKGDLLGTWTATRKTDNVVTILQGIKNVAGTAATVEYAKGAYITEDEYLKKYMNGPLAANEAETETRSPEALLEEAIQTADSADVIVAVLGEVAGMSGEAGSRSLVDIPESQRNLLKELVNIGKPVVLVLINGRPLALSEENEMATAMLEAWAPGVEGGNAIADVLFGDYNPSGKLTTSFPRNVGQIPIYYNHLNTGRPYIEGKERYVTSYIDVPNSPLFPFGYGLSYTKFNYSEITLNKKELKGNEILSASITVANIGQVAGEEVVQLYINDPVASISRPVKELKGYQKITLKPGESKVVHFDISTELLKFYNSKLKYDWEPGDFNLYIGTSSAEVKAARFTWNK